MWGILVKTMTRIEYTPGKWVSVVRFEEDLPGIVKHIDSPLFFAVKNLDIWTNIYFYRN